MDIPHGEAEIFLEMTEDLHFPSDTLDATRLARRHLAEEGLIDGVAPVGNAGDFHERIVSRRSHVSPIFAKRSFRFSALTGNFSLHHDLSRGRDLQVHGAAPYDLNRLPANASCHRKLIRPVRKRGHCGQPNYRIGAEDHSDFGAATLGLIFTDVLVHVARRIDHNTGLTGTLDLNAIDAHVLNAGFRVAGEDERRGVIRARVLAHRPDRGGQHLNIRRIPHVHHFLAGSAFHQPRGQGIFLSLRPLLQNSLQIRFQGSGVDRPGTAEYAYHQRNIAPLDAVKHQRRAAFLGNGPEGLPADRTELPIFIDFRLDVAEESFFLQHLQIFAQIPVGHSYLPQDGMEL